MERRALESLVVAELYLESLDRSRIGDLGHGHAGVRHATESVLLAGDPNARHDSQSVSAANAPDRAHAGTTIFLRRSQLSISESPGTPVESQHRLVDLPLVQ